MIFSNPPTPLKYGKFHIFCESLIWQGTIFKNNKVCSIPNYRYYGGKPKQVLKTFEIQTQIYSLIFIYFNRILLFQESSEEPDYDQVPLPSLPLAPCQGSGHNSGHNPSQGPGQCHGNSGHIPHQTSLGWEVGLRKLIKTAPLLGQVFPIKHYLILNFIWST